MRVDIEGGKYTYVFEDGRARLLRYGEPSRSDVVGDKFIYCMAAEIAELRQQLSSLLQDLYVIKDQCGLWGGEATRAGNLLSQLLAAFVATELLNAWKPKP